MKATLEFDLPEEDYEWKRAVRCGDVECAISDFKNNLRNYWKHGHEFKTADEAIDKIYEELHEAFEDIGGEVL